MIELLFVVICCCKGIAEKQNHNVSLYSLLLFLSFGSLASSPQGRAARNQWANVVAGHAEGVGGDEKERDSRGTLLAFACVLCVCEWVKLTGKPLI